MQLPQDKGNMVTIDCVLTYELPGLVNRTNNNIERLQTLMSQQSMRVAIRALISYVQV